MSDGAAFVLLAAALCIPAPAQTLRFSGRVANGEKFEKELPGGLRFALQPDTGDPGAIAGWTIEVSPSASHPKECDDFVWVVTQPYRGYNARYLDTSYGTTAEEAVKFSPREFRFVLNCADYQREAARVDRALWPGNYSESEVKEALARLGTSPHGTGRLWIRDSRISAAPKMAAGKNLGRMDWIAFDVEIAIPKRR